MHKLLAPRAQASTTQVPRHQRLEFWEAHNATTLIGLTCSTHHPDGLEASERSFDLGQVRLTEIRGNQHVIERPRHMLKTHPKEALFACILLEGSAFFFQAGECTTLTAGDVIAYATDLPYLYGFTGDMRQLIVEIDFSHLGPLADAHRPRSVIKLDHRVHGGRWLAQALRRMTQGFVDHPRADAAPRVAARARALLQALLMPDAMTPEFTDSVTWRLLRADLFIAEHLTDPELDADVVARAVGVSLRHLNRAYATRGCTVHQWLMGQRLERASQELADPAWKRVPVAGIAYRWGFATPAHFSRLFKERYGLSPLRHRHLEAGGAVASPELSPDRVSKAGDNIGDKTAGA